MTLGRLHVEWDRDTTWDWLPWGGLNLKDMAFWRWYWLRFLITWRHLPQTRKRRHA